MRGKYLVVGFIIALLLISLGAANVRASSANFSPQEIWTYQPKIDTTYDPSMGTPRNSMETSLHYDVNGDGVTDVVVEIYNYTAMTYTVILLSGADGSVLYKNKFTDVEYTTAPVQPSIYSVTYIDDNGNLQALYQFVIFGNHSDNKRISVYKLGSDLGNESYKGIELPTSINTPYGSIPISMHYVDIRIQNYNYSAKEGLLIMGYYGGSYYGYNVVELNVTMLDYDLNVVWQKKELSLSMSGMVPFGMDITKLNGEGFNQENTVFEGADMVFVNESSGNTNIEAIEATNGSMLWNLTLPGFVYLSSPFDFFGTINFIDYNNDSRVDLQIVTYYNNQTYVYFVDADGNIVARYNWSRVVPIQDAIPTYTFNPSKPATVQHNTIDLNGDGTRDIVFLVNYTLLVAFDIKDNQTLYTKDLSGDYSYYFGLMLSKQDINGDGIDDLFLYGGNMSSGQYWYNLNYTALDGATGKIIWSATYEHVINAALGPIYPVYFSDLNGDGYGNDIIIQGYTADSSGVYANVTVISLKDGSKLLTFKVNSSVSNTDFHSWSTLAAMIGDVNGDGINDIEISMDYSTTLSNNEPYVDTFIRIFSGSDGKLLWKGDVIGQHTTTNMERMSWKSGRNLFAANNNDILITTEDSVSDYEVQNAVPEFSAIFLPALAITIVAAVIYLRRK